MIPSVNLNLIINWSYSFLLQHFIIYFKTICWNYYYNGEIVNNFTPIWCFSQSVCMILKHLKLFTHKFTESLEWKGGKMLFYWQMGPDWGICAWQSQWTSRWHGNKMGTHILCPFIPPAKGCTIHFSKSLATILCLRNVLSPSGFPVRETIYIVERISILIIYTLVSMLNCELRSHQ